MKNRQCGGEFGDLSDAAVDRIQNSVTKVRPLSRGLVEAAAFYYREEKRREAAGTGRGLRANLKLLRSSAKSCASVLENSEFQVLVCLTPISDLFGGGNDSLPRIQRLSRDLRWLERTTLRASKAFGTKVLDFRFGTNLAIDLLGIAYERATGRKPTHSAHLDGEYVGGAQSPFGRLAIAFFAEVDPTLGATTIGNLLRKRLHRGKRQR